MIADPDLVLDLVIRRIELRPLRPRVPDRRYVRSWPACSCGASPLSEPEHRDDVLAEVRHHDRQCERGLTMSEVVSLWDAKDEDCGREE